MIVLVDLEKGPDGKTAITADSWHALEKAVETTMRRETVDGCLSWIKRTAETLPHRQLEIEVRRNGWTWTVSPNDAYLRSCETLERQRAERAAEIEAEDARKTKQTDLFGG